MFTGFATENTPAIQVWDFSKSAASISAIRSVYLTDDCAPIQYFRTGFGTTPIRVYLPPSPPEGKVIRFINAPAGGSNQSVSIFSSDAYDPSYAASGTAAQGSSGLYYVGGGKSLDLCYARAVYTTTSVSFSVSSSWISLTEATISSNAYRGVALGGGSVYALSAFAAGGGAVASGTFSVALGGQNASASGTEAIALGSSIASGGQAVALGGSQTANGGGSIVFGGVYGNSRSVTGMVSVPASSGPVSATSGVQQSGLLVLGRQTTDATVTTLSSSSSAAGTTNQIILPNNAAFYFRGSVIANVTGGGNTKAWSFEGAIKRGANAASTTLMQSTLNVVASDPGAAAWDVSLFADTTNGGLQVRVTGAAATTIRWVCKIETTEVTY